MRIKCAKEERYQVGRGRPLDFDAHGGVVYYYLNNIGSHYDRTETEYRINAAFAEWNKHFAPLRFLPTGNKDKAYVQLFFTGVRPQWKWLVRLFPSLRRSCSIEPIPFDENTYGYGFEAYHTEYGGHIYLNDDIPWSDLDIALSIVTLHEAGHVFNIGHTQSHHDGEIMLPEYDLTNHITQDTIDIINLDTMYAPAKSKYLFINQSKKLPDVT